MYPHLVNNKLNFSQITAFIELNCFNQINFILYIGSD